MRVGLFIPCYMDAFEPEVGIATLELLEKLGCTVDYPFDQTCCGQPMTNTGCHNEGAGAEALFVKNFSSFDYIVAPSGSCVHQVRVNMTAIEQTPEVRGVRERTFELTEFIHDILKVKEFPWAHFPHKVGMHYHCNSLRRILVVLLGREAIVPGLQDAYEHPSFRTAHYAVFHTGPSATGDIEGVLIHGAQGVRSLTVVLTGQAASA